MIDAVLQSDRHGDQGDDGGDLVAKRGQWQDDPDQAQHDDDADFDDDRRRVKAVRVRGHRDDDVLEDQSKPDHQDVEEEEEKNDLRDGEEQDPHDLNTCCFCKCTLSPKHLLQLQQDAAGQRERQQAELVGDLLGVERAAGVFAGRRGDRGVAAGEQLAHAIADGDVDDHDGRDEHRVGLDDRKNDDHDDEDEDQCETVAHSLTDALLPVAVEARVVVQMTKVLLSPCLVFSGSRSLWVARDPVHERAADVAAAADRAQVVDLDVIVEQVSQHARAEGGRANPAAGKAHSDLLVSRTRAQRRWTCR